MRHKSSHNITTYWQTRGIAILFLPYQYLDYYQIDQVVIQNDQVIIDTLKNIKFDLIELNENKTRVDLINVELNRPGQIQDWKYLKRMSQFYQNQIHEGILKKVKTRE